MPIASNVSYSPNLLLLVRSFLCLSQRLQAIVKIMGGYRVAKKSKRRVWTKDEVRVLKALAKKKRPAARIGRTLKRTEGATRQKAFSIGLSLDTRA
jgi:hypothetical protein